MMNTETYPATVSNNQDPEKRGRLKVTCPGLLGDEESELPMWVEPALMWGWFVIPDVGELIEVEAVTGSDEDEQFGQASIDNLDLKWRGTRYYVGGDGGEGSQETPLNEDFKKNYGKRRGFATPGGHTFVMDDTDDDRSVSLTWVNKDEERSFMSFDKDGSFVLGTKTGHTVYLNVDNGELSIIDQSGNTYASDTDGIKIIGKDGDLVEIKGGNIQVLAANAVTLSCKNAVIDAGSVSLGGQPLTEAIILGTTFITTVFNLHTHPTGVGPSGPPLPSDQIAALATLSTVVFAK